MTNFNSTSSRSRLRILASSAALFLAAPLATQAQRQAWNSPTPVVGSYARGMVGLGDLDGDGKDEFAITDHDASPGGLFQAGTVLILRADGTLLRSYHGENPSDAFGVRVANAGDLDGDHVDDLLVVAPEFDGAAGSDSGKVYAYSGTGPLLWSWEGPLMGYPPTTPVGTRDLNGDGRRDVLIGAPSTPGGGTISRGRVYVLDGDGNEIGAIEGPNALARFGYEIAGVDDPNSELGFAVGTRETDSTGHLTSSSVYVYGHQSNLAFIARVAPPGTSLMDSIVIPGDLDGDGRPDLVVGSPTHDGTAGNGCGLVRAYDTDGFWLWDLEGTTAGERFGDTVVSLRDVTGDCVHDFAAGSTGFDPGTAGTGRISFIDGTQIDWDVHPPPTSQVIAFGRTLGAADIDGDGAREILAGGVGEAGAWTHNPGGPIYCTGKVSSLGCLPSITSSGTASASSPIPFKITATPINNGVTGILGYGFSSTASPFKGGFLCVHPPLRRTGTMSSGGSGPQFLDCSGTLTQDFNSIIQSGADPNLTPGQQVFAQWWFRDIGNPQGAGLSNAIQFRICP